MYLLVGGVEFRVVRVRRCVDQKALFTVSNNRKRRIRWEVVLLIIIRGSTFRAAVLMR